MQTWPQLSLIRQTFEAEARIRNSSGSAANRYEHQPETDPFKVSKVADSGHRLSLEYLSLDS